MKREIKRLFAMFLTIVLMVCGIFNCGVTESNAEEAALADEDSNSIVMKENTELSSDESVEVSYNITSKWSGHYNMDVTLVNVSGEMIDDWEMCFDFKDKIENIWNAKVVECEEGQSVTIKNVDWNQDIDADKSVTFGMTVSYQGEIEFPQECYLTRECSEVDDDDYSIEYIQHSKWDEHVNGEIIITNTGKQRIEDWKLDFETSNTVKEIENIWNAKLIEIDEGSEAGSYCQVDNATYNQNIEPGQSVRFGFIVKCDGDLKIEETTLYHMLNAEYEDDIDETLDDIIDPDNPNWEPRYDLDDFDTYEEYEEYCNRIGYHPQINMYARAKAKINSVEPSVRTKIVAEVKEKTRGKAIQSYLWDDNNLLTLFRKQQNAAKGKKLTAKQKETNNSVLFCKTTRDESGDYNANQKNVVKMLKFSHGQSFERCNIGGGKKYMMAAGATDGKQGWSKSVAFINASTLLSAKKTINYTNNKHVKRITGFKYLVDRELSKNCKIERIDAALSTTKSDFLIVWIKIRHDNKRILALFDMNAIEQELYKKGNKGYYSLKSKKLRDKALVLITSESKNKLQPNESFQSIEVSDEYKSSGSSARKWKIYITSGNEGKKQPLTLTRAVLSLNSGSKKTAGKIDDFCKVNVNIPHNEQGQKILSGACELEGCHIKGEELQFLMTKSNVEDSNYKELKVEQYIVGLDKHFK